MLLAVVKRPVSFNKQDSLISLNIFTSRWVNLNYVKFDAFGSPNEVCIVQQTREFNSLNIITSKYVNINYVKFDAIGSP